MCLSKSAKRLNLGNIRRNVLNQRNTQQKYEMPIRTTAFVVEQNKKNDVKNNLKG
jgi:hypothetical protein